MVRKNLNIMFKLLFIFVIMFNNLVFASEESRIIVIENYLNNIKDLVADFIQISPDGSESNGRFFLSRPGKLRWQYDPPVPILIIINKNLLIHYDFELDQISHAKSEENLASILTRKNIKFDNDLVIKNFEEKNGNISIIIYAKNKEDEGEIELVFSVQPLSIKKINIIDAMKQSTSLSLNNIQTDISLPKELFVLKNPKYFKNERF